MAGGLVADMVRAYSGPRDAMARQVRMGLGEPRALFHLMAACFVFFVASVPAAIRTARGIDADEPVAAAIGAHLFGFLFLAPLLAYAAAFAAHGLARLFGARGSALGARAALFWSLLLAAPLALAVGILGVAAEIAIGPAMLPVVSLLGYAGLALWLWIFAASFAEAEGFSRSGRVAAVVVAAFGLAVGLLAVLTGGASVAS